MSTTSMPPIFRLIAWWRHRKTLCTLCNKAPKDGSRRYCSDECAEWDLHMQAHG